MDAEFLSTFVNWAFGGAIWQSPYVALAAVLQQTNNLRALRIRVAHAIGSRSAWRRTLVSRPDGIPIGLAFSRALASLPAEQKLDLSHLTTLELDAFSDVAPLLLLTPNLERLRLELNAGYAQCINTEFVDALQHVPHLKELIYTPESLRVSNPQIWGLEAMLAIVDVDHPDDEEDRSAELVETIGKRLPDLESLELQRRWYSGQAIVFPASEEPLTAEVRVDSGPITSELLTITWTLL